MNIGREPIAVFQGKLSVNAYIYRGFSGVAGELYGFTVEIITFSVDDGIVISGGDHGFNDTLRFR